jgi:hypothetical protein
MGLLELIIRRIHNLKLMLNSLNRLELEKPQCVKLVFS